MGFIADYHETEEAFLLVYNLGRFSLEWNMVEQFLTATVWELLGNYPIGMAVTGGMGNQSKADVIRRLARESIRDPEVLDRLDFACKAFNVLRENRNIPIHSHSIFPPDEGGKPIWRRATGKGPSGHISAEADAKDLNELIAQTCALGLFVVDLVPYLHPRRKKKLRGAKVRPLPEKFAFPELLREPSPEPPEKPRPSAKIRKKK